MAGKKISKAIQRDTLEMAEAFIEENGTCRSIAAEFEVSKSCVHHRMTKVLPLISKRTYNKVRKILDQNTAERAVRGGKATHDKYANAKKAGKSKNTKKATTAKKTKDTPAKKDKATVAKKNKAVAKKKTSSKKTK